MSFVSVVELVIPHVGFLTYSGSFVGNFTICFGTLALPFPVRQTLPVAPLAGEDRSCKLWDVNNGQCMETLRGHSDEVRCLLILLGMKVGNINSWQM